MAMNNNERFSLAPQMGNIETSTFRRPFNIKLTCDAGKLIPFFYDEMLPGDIFRLDQNTLMRGQTPKFPTMDNAHVSVFYFAIPWRLVWDGTKKFFKENDTAAGIIAPTNEKHVPSLKIPTGGFLPCSPADYLGLPTGVAAGTDVNSLPFRAYREVYNHYFRDQNLSAPLPVNHGDTDASSYDTIAATNLLTVNKDHDMFTSALPFPQKSADVLLPLGTTAPVYPVSGTRNVKDPLIFYSDSSDPIIGGDYFLGVHQQGTASEPYVIDDPGSALPSGPALYGSNLSVDLSAASAATISQVRTAFQLQRVYERLARGGSRYSEFIRSFFRIKSPDARVQIPELIGRYNFELNTREVIQTSGQIDSTTTPTGSTGGYLRAFDTRHVGEYAATEHTIVLGLMCIRTDLTYSQGIDRFFSVKDFTDVYLPALAHISETPIYNRELYAQGTTADAQVFGYQEPWYWYRYKVSKIAGKFKASGTYLDAWHYGEKFGSLPTLSEAFMKSNAGADIGKTLAVSGLATGEQFICDLYVQNTCTRPMPLYSVPGMLDHF